MIDNDQKLEQALSLVLEKIITYDDCFADVPYSDMCKEEGVFCSHWLENAKQIIRSEFFADNGYWFNEAKKAYAQLADKDLQIQRLREALNRMCCPIGDERCGNSIFARAVLAETAPKL